MMKRGIVEAVFVAQEQDIRAMLALSILDEADWLPCDVRILPFLTSGREGTANPEEVAFFTYEGRDGHWPSRWIRTSQNRVMLIMPPWASEAKMRIAIRPRDVGGPGFEHAVLQAAAHIVGARPPVTEAFLQRRRRFRRNRISMY